MKQDMTNPLPATSLLIKTVLSSPGFIVLVIPSHALSNLSGKTSQENDQFFQVPQ